MALSAAESLEFVLTTDQISIGSADGNDFIVRDDTVSSRHARLWRRVDEYRVADLGSHNGVYLNGRRIDRAETLRDGDQVSFGNAAFRFLLDGNAARRTRTRAASATAIATILALLVGGFGLARFLINFDQLERAAEEQGAALTEAAPSSASNLEAMRHFVGGVVHPGSGGEAETGSPAATPEPVPGEDPAEVEAWLGPLNRYRAMAGLSPLSASPLLHRGDYLHSRYLVKNFGTSIAGGINLGPWMHAEDPGKPWFSKEGLAAARTSNVSESWHPRGDPNPSWAIDNWMQVPFHRLAILNPDLKKVGYGTYCENHICIAALNIASTPPMTSVPTPLPKPIEFPPDGTSFPVGDFGVEWPNPLSSCADYAAPTGLPITLQLGHLVAPGFSDYSLKSGTMNGAALAACAFDANTYVNPDPGTQMIARAGLRNAGAIVLVPRRPLTAGRYSVSITAGGHQYQWSFSISG